MIVQGLWIGERLSPMERLSIRSFLANGCEFHLYSYTPLHGVPRGARVLDAAQILPPEKIFRYRDHDSVAGFSNWFRYQVLLERGGAWADLDMVCLRAPPEQPDILVSEDHFDGTAHRTCSFMAAPPGSELVRRAAAECAAADPLRLQWGDTGPWLIDRLSRELGQTPLPPSAFCPLPYMRWRDAISADPEVQLQVRALLDGAFAVHLWHDHWRRSAVNPLTPQHPGSLWEQLRARYAV